MSKPNIVTRPTVPLIFHLKLPLFFLTREGFINKLSLFQETKSIYSMLKTLSELFMFNL